MIAKTEGRDAFLEDETYHRLTAALAAVQPDPFTGKIEPWQFVEVLGGWRHMACRDVDRSGA